MENSRYRKCVIFGIRKLPKSDILLASLPLNPDRCRLWVKASGIEDLVPIPNEKLHLLKYVCGSHFAPECFNAKGNRLLSTAVPALGPNRPFLSDDLFTEFPLHVKSYNKMENKSGESFNPEQTDIKLNVTVETITKKLNKEQALNLRDKRVIATVNDSSSSCAFIPIPSTSKAAMHLTFKQKGEDVPKMEDNEILVKSYKTSRNSRATAAGMSLNKRETIARSETHNKKHGKVINRF